MDLLHFLFLGFLLGLRHALDTDHLAAITNMVSEPAPMRTSNGIGRSVQIGVVWGIGHALILIGVSILFIAFKIEIPSQFAIAAEIAVGVVIVGLGVRAIRNAVNRKVHFHIHCHDGLEHAHIHNHAGQYDGKDHQHAHLQRPLFIGMLHGLAGSSALLLILVSTASTPLSAMSYAAVFGIGTITGMGILSPLIGNILTLAQRAGSHLDFFRYAVGGGSILFGIFWIAQRV